MIVHWDTTQRRERINYHHVQQHKGIIYMKKSVRHTRLQTKWFHLNILKKTLLNYHIGHQFALGLMVSEMLLCSCFGVGYVCRDVFISEKSVAFF